MALSAREMRLLRTFIDGPQTWDAAEFTDVLTSLTAKSLIAPVNDGPMHMLTPAGRAITGSAKIVLFPHSNTNPSPKFRVVSFGDWYNTVGETRPYVETDTYPEARQIADRANAQVGE